MLANPIKKALRITLALLLFATATDCLAQYGIAPTYGKQRRSRYTAPYFNKGLSKFSLSVGLGGSAYDGDLAGFLDFEEQDYYISTPNLNLGLQYRYTNWISFRGDFNLFTLSSDDVHADDRAIPSVYRIETNSSNASLPNFDPNKPRWPVSRNADGSVNYDRLFANDPSFVTYGAEGSIVVQHDLFPKYMIDKRIRRWNLHVFGGVGMAYWEVYDKETGVNASDEENYFSNYSEDFARLTTIIPVGVGFDLYLYENIMISIESGYRFTQTNYLDGHSDKFYLESTGSETNNDAYHLTQVKFVYQFLSSKPYQYNYKRYKRRTGKSKSGGGKKKAFRMGF